MANRPIISTPRMENVIDNTKHDSIDEWLGTPGFAEFLISLPEMDRPHANDYEAHKKKMELFAAREALKTDLKIAYSKHLNAKLGIDLQPDELSSMDEHLDKISVEDPDRIHELSFSLNQFNTYPSRIAEAHTQLQNIADDEVLEGMKKAREEYAQVVETLGRAKGKFGISDFIKRSFVWDLTDGMSRAQQAGRAIYDEVENMTVSGIKIVKNMGKMSNSNIDKMHRDYESALASLDAKLAEYEVAAKSKEDVHRSFMGVKQDLFYTVSRVQGVRDVVQRKVDAYLAAPTQVQNARGIKAAQERFAQVVSANNENDDTGFDLFSKDQNDSYMARRGGVDEFIEDAVLAIVSEAFSKVSTDRNRLTSLESGLEDLFRLETLGSKDIEATKDLIIDTINEVVAQLPPGRETEVKKLLASRLIVKIQIDRHRKPPKMRA